MINAMEPAFIKVLVFSLPWTSSIMSVIEKVIGNMKMPTETEIPRMVVIFTPKILAQIKTVMKIAKRRSVFLFCDIGQEDKEGERRSFKKLS